MTDKSKYGYPDLTDADFVYKALLGHGMFADKMPPCLSSESFFRYVNSSKKINLNKKIKSYYHACITYKEVKYTIVDRKFSIPHPESYLYLCSQIKKYWSDINLHIGEANPPKNKTHVRKIEDTPFNCKPHIFEMGNYENRIEEQDEINEYSLDAKYMAIADIKSCFPSMYSHAIPWAVYGIAKAKSGEHEGDPWGDDLDKASRTIKDGETNGLLIGPHTSSIISEIILTSIDKELMGKEYNRGKGYDRYIRHIDDYRFYATNEKEAEEFIQDLANILNKYELSLNQEKTEIIAMPVAMKDSWVNQLSYFKFDENIEQSINDIVPYLDCAFDLAKKHKKYSIMYYAIKVISNIKLNKRAKLHYTRRVFHIALHYPYLVPFLEELVINKFEIYSINGIKDTFNSFVNLLMETGLEKNHPSCVAYAFYYARKYNLRIKLYHLKTNMQKLLSMQDCISLLLAIAYLGHAGKKNTKLAFISVIKDYFDFKDKRTREQFWILLYEFIPDCLSDKEDNFLYTMESDKSDSGSKKVSFLKWD